MFYLIPSWCRRFQEFPPSPTLYNPQFARIFFTLSLSAMAPKAAGIAIPDPPLKKKSGRISLACTNCRKRKIKCDTNDDIPPEPCGRCVKNKLLCQYLTVAEDPEARPNSQSWDPYEPQTAQNPYSYGQEWGYPQQVCHDPSMSSYYNQQSTLNYPYTMTRDCSRQLYPYSCQQTSYTNQQYLAQMYSRGTQDTLWPANASFDDSMTQASGVPYPGDFSQQACTICSQTPCICQNIQYPNRFTH